MLNISKISYFGVGLFHYLHESSGHGKHSLQKMSWKLVLKTWVLETNKNIAWLHQVQEQLGTWFNYPINIFVSEQQHDKMSSIACRFWSHICSWQPFLLYPFLGNTSSHMDTIQCTCQSDTNTESLCPGCPCSGHVWKELVFAWLTSLLHSLLKVL